MTSDYLPTGRRGKRASARNDLARLSCIRLGTGHVAGAGVGNKGALLDRAARAGLAVPEGIVLLDEAWQRALSAGLAVVQGDTVIAADPVGLLDALDLASQFSNAQLARDSQCPVAVRSAFSAEDGAGESLAGFFTSRLFVEMRQPAALAAALCDVWASALRRPGAFRRDVLIMRMVAANQAGVAFTERDFEDDLINATAGTADALVSGAVAGEMLLLPKLRSWERSGEHSGVAPFQARLQSLLRDVRRVFGAGDWDVEWADDGERCWLVQIRPVTRPSRRNEAFTIANHKEILPDLPSRFMTSVIAACAEGLFAYYRYFDRSLPARRPFIEVFYGRPYINLSLLAEMMRIFGLPTRLVVDNIGGAADQERGLNLGRLIRKTPVLARLGLAQLRSVGAARRAIGRMWARAERPGATFGECAETLRWLYTALVTEMFSLTSAMSGPLALLRRAGVLDEHNARQQTITTAMFADLEPLRALVASNPESRAALEHGELPADRRFRVAWEAYLQKHGHRGVYESDIARPRMREAPGSILSSLAHPTGRRNSPPRRTLVGLLTLPIWWQAGRAIRAREELRYNAMLAFERVRIALLALADRAVADGALPNRAALWDLDIEEASRLDGGWRPDASFFAQRAAEIERLRGYQLPDLFCRFDDLERSSVGAAVSAERRLVGISLTTGEVRGRAWVLAEPATARPDGFVADQTILVARSVDAGWIPTFGRVAGVVVETGGDLSHGSIILREIGLPAITNVRDATRAISTGDDLLLRAGAGVVERVA
jgi:phosphohistidine swiveling domain-containing protein